MLVKITPLQITEFVSDFKEASKKYTTANRELVNYFKKGSIAEANTLHKERYCLVGTDVQETIDCLNALLGKLDYDSIS